MRILLVCVLAALLAPAITQADPEPATSLVNVAPASNVYADALIRQALTVADTYWAGQGLDPICPATLLVYDEQDGVTDARGEMPGCNVYIDRHYRDAMWATYTNAHLAREDRILTVAQLCSLTAHERGHNHGFGHTTTGVMAVGVVFIPPECEAWARMVVPLHRKHSRAALHTVPR